MPLPIRTVVADIEMICDYFAGKPGGVSAEEAIYEKALDRSKLAAVRFWGLIESTGSKLRLSPRGRLVVRDNGAHRAKALREVVAAIPPYGSIIARAVHRNATIVLSTEVAAYWHRHFRADVHMGILNHQTVCFLRVAEGADLGRLVVGRKGLETRFELAEHDARAFVDGANITASHIESEGECDIGSSEEVPARVDSAAQPNSGAQPKRALRRGNRVFVTHRNNKKILEQVRELVAYGKLEPVVAQDRENSAKPYLHNLMDEMRGCDTAVIHVGVDGLLRDADRQPQISGDVLIQIGAAIALYGRNFVLLVEDGVELPSNLQGLCECRYCDDELNMPATMKLLRAFSDTDRRGGSTELLS